MLTKRSNALFFLAAFSLSGIGIGLLLKSLMFGETKLSTNHFSSFPVPVILEKDKSQHQLSISHYRQTGDEIQLLAYSASSNLTPFLVEIEQAGEKKPSVLLVGKPGAWLRLSTAQLQSGNFTLTLQSRKDTTCRVKIELAYDREKANEIAETDLWFRQGSSDDLLDVRVVRRNGGYYLKDFAGYHDGRSKTYFLEGMIVDSLEKGIPVAAGYHYSVVARWIDAPYEQWWNKSKHRTSRQQSIWIEPDTREPELAGNSQLTPVRIPEWFKPSRSFNPQFDSILPEFSPITGKLVMMYRLNQDRPAASYFKRGITHLPRWEENAPDSKKHWTEPPGFFQDRDQDWFGSLSQSEVEAYADQIGPIGAYAFDFEFWNRQYNPKVKQRLLWFASRLRANYPSLYLFDYWGGSAYTNTTFQQKDGIFSPLSFSTDYTFPKSNHFNFAKTPDGDHFGRYFNITAIDVYPRPSLRVGGQSHVLNNYLILSAVHASRINRLFDFQQQNKTVWFAWNRFMPLYHDPPFFWDVETTRPAGTLVFGGLEMIPASQALAISLFSLVEGDGFYLWSDSQPWGKGENNYKIQDDTNLHTATGWFPHDGISDISAFSVAPGGNESPRYPDYPTDFFALGNWMVKTEEAIIDGGKKQDLAFFLDNKWNIPQKEQAVLAAHHQQPFVTSVVKGNRILVLAIDSFQAPNKKRILRIRLPDKAEAEIELYGNWPALYTGKLTTKGN